MIYKHLVELKKIGKFHALNSLRARQLFVYKMNFKIWNFESLLMCFLRILTKYRMLLRHVELNGESFKACKKLINDINSHINHSFEVVTAPQTFEFSVTVTKNCEKKTIFIFFRYLMIFVILKILQSHYSYFFNW
jgi:hypothetical protein